MTAEHDSGAGGGSAPHGAPAAAQPLADDHGAAAHGHPSEAQYIKVALVLATITGIEVAVYYVSAVRSVLVPMLLTFSIVKFALVALWFMHLRFDNRLFRRLFVTGLVLASGVYLVVLTTFHVWTRGRS